MLLIQYLYSLLEWKLQESRYLVHHIHQHIPSIRMCLTYVSGSMNICWINEGLFLFSNSKTFLLTSKSISIFWYCWPPSLLWKRSISFAATVFFSCFPHSSVLTLSILLTTCVPQDKILSPYPPLFTFSPSKLRLLKAQFRDFVMIWGMNRLFSFWSWLQL